MKSIYFKDEIVKSSLPAQSSDHQSFLSSLRATDAKTTINSDIISSSVSLPVASKNYI